MTEYTKAEAKAADRILAKLQVALYAVDDIYDRAVDSLHYRAGDKKRWISRSTSVWTMNTAEARENAQAIADDADAPSYNRDDARKAVAKYDEARAALGAAHEDIQRHEAANYKGWLRFFLVQDGHIHRSTHCSSLRPTTRIGWLPELSGETEAEAVAAHGAMLCTKCFPSAPVEWTQGKPPAADQCPGQRAVPGSYNPLRSSVYGTCEHCGEVVSVTSTGKARKHKLPKSK